MKVFVVVKHYDRGSDEVCVEGVFASMQAALDFVKEEFPGWAPLAGVEFARDSAYFYADPEDPDMSDRVFIDEQEVK